MIEGGVWHIIETVLKYAIAPMIAMFFWMFKKHDKKVQSLEARVNILEKDTAVVKSKLDDIKEDIREIKKGIDKLIDRR